ncbi:MAG TPA: hypothetical protein VN611_14480, partial [Patescibacteria group bacterium]|nr:hypothetical protein [Patescibacteria group bacterium]
IYGFQVRNPAKPLDSELFRYYALRRLRFIRLTDIPFQPGTGYSPTLLKGCRQLIATLDIPAKLSDSEPIRDFL